MAAWEEEAAEKEMVAWEEEVSEDAAAWVEQEETAWEEGPLVVAAWEEEAALTRRTGEPALLRVSILFMAAGIPSRSGNSVAA